MTATKTATISVDELSAKVDRLAEMFLKSLESKAPVSEPVVPMSAGKVDVDAMSHAEVRKLAVENDVPVSGFGKVNGETRKLLSAKLNGSTPKVSAAQVQQAKVSGPIATRFGSVMPKAERDGVRVSAKDAAESLTTHPLREAVLLVTSDEWRAIAQMGAANKYIRTKAEDGTVKVTVDPNGGFKPNPGNLNGFDRRQARNLSFKPGTSAKAWTLYQGCLILAKLQAAGYAV